MIRRSLTTLALLVAVPAGILTTVAVSSAGASQGITHVRVADAGANSATPVSRVKPVNRAEPVKTHCITKKMNHAHTVVTLRCEGGHVSAGAAATAAAQVTGTSNAHAQAAATADGGFWLCVYVGTVVASDGSVWDVYVCTWVPGDGGGS